MVRKSSKWTGAVVVAVAALCVPPGVAGAAKVKNGEYTGTSSDGQDVYVGIHRKVALTMWNVDSENLTCSSPSENTRPIFSGLQSVDDARVKRDRTFKHTRSDTQRISLPTVVTEIVGGVPVQHSVTVTTEQTMSATVSARVSRNGRKITGWVRATNSAKPSSENPPGVGPMIEGTCDTGKVHFTATRERGGQAKPGAGSQRG